MIIAVVSQKGGTGKTTVATNLAACYAAQGCEVMLVDADPQHSTLDWKADRPPTLPRHSRTYICPKRISFRKCNICVRSTPWSLSMAVAASPQRPAPRWQRRIS